MRNAKKRLLLFLLTLVAFALLLSSVPLQAAEESPARQIYGGILEAKAGGDGEAWIRGALAAEAGTGAEWFAFALAGGGDWDLSPYRDALLRFLRENEVRSAATRLKYALCLAAAGSGDGYIARALETSVGEGGLMTWVFGLHLLHSGVPCGSHTEREALDALLSLQLEDGGWAAAGQRSDVDSTAMVLGALAPYAEEARVAAAVERALALLSRLQLEDGDFAAFGVPNPESGAQVIIALCALGIDPEDGRFVKDGKGLWDGIEKYRLENGAFCHSAGGEENAMATAQVLCAAVASLRAEEGRGSLYSLDRFDPSRLGEEAPAAREMDYRVWVSLLILGLGGAVCLLLVLCRKRHFKNFVAVLLGVAVALVLVWVTNVQSADGYYGAWQEKENPIGRVTLSIRCDAVAGRAEHIPKDGVILAETELAIAEGDSVYTVLLDAARKYQIQLENDGGALSPYISGIAHLYEFEFGDLSGWVYLVNGESPSVGAGSYILKDGDRVEWIYSLEMGKGAE